MTTAEERVLTEHRFSILTHNGSITITNPATGGHRTFRIRTQKDDANFAPGKRIVSLLTGTDNEASYTGFGFVFDRGIVLWKKRRTAIFKSYKDMLENPAKWEEKHDLEYLYEGQCRRCNRTLTVPESIKTGIGPICAGRE